MKIRHLTYLLLVGLIAFSCNRNVVKVVEFDPQGEVQELQSFTVTFDKDLAPAEAQGEWMAEEFITFDPPIPGRFKWLSANTLLFSPDRPLMPSQDYTARLNGKAIRFNTTYSLDADPVQFHTAHFDVSHAEIFYTQVPHSDHQVQVVANLNFNYDVSPEAVASHLSVSQDGKSISNFQVTTEEPSKVIAVSIGEFQQTEKTQEFVLTLDDGLNSVLAKKALTSDRSFSLSLPPITRLAITGATSGYDGQQGWVEIMTTQEVDASKVKDYIELSPSTAGLRYQVDQNHIRIAGNLTPGNEVKLKVKAGLPGLYGGILENEFTQTLAMADLSPSLSFADKGLYLMRGGEENINLEAININKAELRVYEVFKNNLLFFFYQNYEYNELYYANSYRNDYGTSYDVNYFGKELSREDITFAPTKNLQQSHTINLSDVINQRFKGIYMVQANSDQDWWLRDARLVVISDIGLIAKFAGDELHVFVNSLKTALPMSGVEVKIISSNNQTLMTATTGPDGVAHFTGVNTENEGFNPALVMAEKGDDFNFLDVRQARVDKSRYEVDGKVIEQDGYDCYVYGDRNLYRPGETAYISAIVRDANLGIVEGIPLVMKIRSPPRQGIRLIPTRAQCPGII